MYEGKTATLKLSVPEKIAHMAANSRRGYWFVTHTVAVNMAMTKTIYLLQFSKQSFQKPLKSVIIIIIRTSKCDNLQ